MVKRRRVERPRGRGSLSETELQDSLEDARYLRRAGARCQRARKAVFIRGVRPSALAGEGSPRFGLHWEN